MIQKKNELYHHGIKGQKWGVRRYQNSDGSLTAEGKKKAQADADKLSYAMGKHLDSTNAFQRSLKRRYLVDTEGSNRWDKSGKGYFDPDGGVIIYDKNKFAAKQRNEKVYVDLKKTLSKKYDNIQVEAAYQIDTGRAYSKITLSKNGQKFISEIVKDYGAFDTSKQVEFQNMFKKDKH